MSEILEFLKDNLGIILSILVPSVITIILYAISIKSKKISFTKIYTWKLVNTDTKFISNKLSIKIGKKTIKDLSVFIFELKNTWKVVVDKSDFIDWKDLIIEFKWWELLLSNLKETTPDYLKDDVNFLVKENQLCIKPFTINTWDSLIFEVFYEWKNKKIIPKPRIKWITKLKKVNFIKQKLFFLFFAFLFANLSIFLKALDKSLISTKSVFDIFFKDNVEIQNIYLKICNYLLIIVIFYFIYRIVKVENTSDRLRWRIRWKMNGWVFERHLTYLSKLWKN